MRRRSEIVPRPWATGAPAKRPVSGQRINCLGDLDWPRWEGPEQGSRNCVGGAAERHYADRKVGSARGSRLPHPFLLNKEGKIHGVPEEPEPGANDACLKSPAVSYREPTGARASRPLICISSLRASPRKCQTQQR